MKEVNKWYGLRACQIKKAVKNIISQCKSASEIRQRIIADLGCPYTPEVHYHESDHAREYPRVTIPHHGGPIYINC